MTTTNFPTRNQIERADPLTFDGVTRGSDPQIDAVYSAKREHKREQARRAQIALNDPAAPTAAPEAPADEPPGLPTIEIQTTVAHRGRSFVVVSRGYTLDQLCDMLDKRGYASADTAQPAAPLAAADDLPEGWKLCRKHGAPMRPRNKQNEHWHSHNVGTTAEPCWCKGYPGADSPGYER